MRDFKGMKRQRGRNRKPSSGGNANNANPNRSWDSQGPENIKVRGNAQTVYERYQQLARDAGSSGDRVLAENYLQHAEHYFRVLRALQPQRPVSEIAARELTNQGFDIDFEDETGAQAAAFLAAQQAADRAQQQTDNRDRDNSGNNNQDRDRNQDRGQDRVEGNQNREWRDRDQNRDRDNQNRSSRDQNRDQPRDQNSGQNANAHNRDRDDRAPRADADASSEEGESREGGRRETRRERWERRREERNRRFEAEGGQPGAEDTAEYDPAKDGSDRDESTQAEASTAVAEIAQPAPDKPERAPRRARATREPAAVSSDEPVGLPSFLTRSSAPTAATSVATDDSDAEPAPPKRRAPRRKVEAPVDGTE